MTISEPATLITDYALGALTGVLAWRLFQRNRTLRQQAVRSWALALVATAFASLLGGTYHGFAAGMTSSAAAALWTATTLFMGVASFCLLASVVTASFAGSTRLVLLVAAAIKLSVYAWWMLSHHAFVYVIGEYGSTLLVVLVLVAAKRVTGAPGHRAYLAGGVLISIAAALVQQSGVGLHDHFNHNDLMHVIQMVAVWLLYEGGRRLMDARGGDDGVRP